MEKSVVDLWLLNQMKKKDFFDLKKIDLNNFKCDQIYINQNINKLKYELLPLDLFPNGYYYYSQKKK